MHIASEDSMNGRHLDMFDSDGLASEDAAHKARQADILLEHLRSGKSITQDEALLKYAIRSLPGPVRALRVRGYVIETIRGKVGMGQTKYRLLYPDPVFPNPYSDSIEEDEDMESSQPDLTLETPVEIATEAPNKKSVQAQTVTIRIGAEGPELQVTGGDNSEAPFFKLSEFQIKYLAVNLSLFSKV